MYSIQAVGQSVCGPVGVGKVQMEMSEMTGIVVH